MKIRHYGPLAGRLRKQKLQQSRQLLLLLNLATALACAQLTLTPDAARIDLAQLPQGPHCGADFQKMGTGSESSKCLSPFSY
jgi:hypothetical protein